MPISMNRSSFSIYNFLASSNFGFFLVVHVGRVPARRRCGVYQRTKCMRLIILCLSVGQSSSSLLHLDACIFQGRYQVP